MSVTLHNKWLSFASKASETAKMPRHGRKAMARYDKLARMSIFERAPRDLVHVITAHMQMHTQNIHRDFAFQVGAYGAVRSGVYTNYSYLTVPVARVVLPGEVTTTCRIRVTLPRSAGSLIGYITTINVVSAAFGCRLFMYRNDNKVWCVWHTFDGVMCEVVHPGDAYHSYSADHAPSVVQEDKA